MHIKVQFYVLGIYWKLFLFFSSIVLDDEGILHVCNLSVFGQEQLEIIIIFAVICIIFKLLFGLSMLLKRK